MQYLRVELREQAVFRRTHAGWRHTDNLFRRIKEDRQDRRQRVNIADRDTLDIGRQCHGMIGMVDDGDGRRARRLGLVLCRGGARRSSEPPCGRKRQRQQQAQGQKQCDSFFHFEFSFFIAL